MQTNGKHYEDRKNHFRNRLCAGRIPGAERKMTWPGKQRPKYIQWCSNSKPIIPTVGQQAEKRSSAPIIVKLMQ